MNLITGARGSGKTRQLLHWLDSEPIGLFNRRAIIVPTAQDAYRIGGGGRLVVPVERCDCLDGDGPYDLAIDDIDRVLQILLRSHSHRRIVLGTLAAEAHSLDPTPQAVEEHVASLRAILG